MLIVLDRKDILHHIFIPEVATVSMESYNEMHGCLWEAVQPEIWEARDCMLLLVSALPYQLLFTKHGTMLLPHLPHLTVCNVHCIP
jgi:hypothetical protein